MFSKVLIANRGAIACRIIRTLKSMGVTSVAVYSEADADSRHVLDADEAWSLGEGAAAQTYLDQNKLIAIARQTGAQAIHPGYGFLSENPDFARRCVDEGLVFLGPTPEQMVAFGLKHEARALAEAANVPLLPGTGLLASLEEALEKADVIGYPVMLKSTAGGGGIGMQRCFSAEELRAAYASVKRLSENNFSNGGMFLEKFIENARHIEVQMFGDGQGKVIAIGERDCSAQRRNQKVIEECPAPNLSDEVRQALQATAVQLGQQVSYRSAGTVEYVYDDLSGQFYFLEVNTRLQVEHGVTEQVYGVDLVRWMIELGAGELAPLESLNQILTPKGHAIQVRLYAEDPAKNFRPSAGLISAVQFPEQDRKSCRIDHWLDAGLEVPPFFDPMLAKLIAWSGSREQTITTLLTMLHDSTVYGIETNKEYLCALLNSEVVQQGKVLTRTLNEFSYDPSTIDVLSGGTQTTIQDFPGRVGYWDIGVPPSGPMDNWSFRLGNRLLNNDAEAAGLEITLSGPTLKFNTARQIVLAGATLDAKLDGEALPMWQVVTVPAGATLQLGKVATAGARSYLLLAGGLDCPHYLGSRSTFTLGQFGGHVGRSIQAGDVLHLPTPPAVVAEGSIPTELQPAITNTWELRVIYGPHGAPDFFTDQDIDTFFATDYEVHYNSSRTGVRLIGPKPEWARADGGEAGLHPSNLHDNAYAIGTVDFTGDMPVILGPDGPSLGGFVCPATIVKSDLWKMGQLKAGDKVRFIPISIADAEVLDRAQLAELESLTAKPVSVAIAPPTTPVLKTLPAEKYGEKVVYRPSGDDYLLVEYGAQVLDIRLRFRAHALMLWVQEAAIEGVLELTPGIRSLQIHYDNLQLPLTRLLELLEQAESELTDIEQITVPARIVHLPLSWDDEATRLAIRKYDELVRKDAPWCPSNIEFIRRINGLDSIEQVKEIVFNANYLVMGLGDVYLGAPVATPLDPRHRLVTTKYNPARTWTPENAVGIGGAYLCVYGMEGPGGYQFVGRTLQMWNRYRQTAEFSQPWLLRFFDQIKFYEVDADELLRIRREFPRGRYPIKIEEIQFSLADYNKLVSEHADEICEAKERQQTAFEAERQRWIETGQANFSADGDMMIETGEEEELPDHHKAVESLVSGNVWQVLVEEGQTIKAGQPLLIIESMKMEIEVLAPQDGKIIAINREAGQQVRAGQRLLVLEDL
ncbi:urea carboxylase [Tolumonas osonensis]|uniref:Biotin carboxylase n=1 Tax=Tolumonas osonensis TaxID=675874 RepID=A0A841GFH9_9GAMM|nr:urea carboxylase [Tolumonas osonensis]MBB6056719.1 urea carboxylase [Tolumonas osonensis]